MFKSIKLNIVEWLSREGIRFEKKDYSSEISLEQCPYCGRQKKSSINADTGLFGCFSGKCQTKGNFVKFVADFKGISYRDAARIVYGEEISKLDLNSVRKLVKEDLLDINDGDIRQGHVKALPLPIQVPHFFTALKPSHKDAWEYLESRGIDAETVDSLSLYVWLAARRIVFPVTIDGVWYGYVARDYTGSQEPKVINSKGNFRSFTVWNHENVEHSSDLIICEGTVSAVKCGINRSIALLGKVATQGQVELIHSLNPKRILICLDVDASLDRYKLKRALSSRNDQIYYVELPPILMINCAGCARKLEFDERRPLAQVKCVCSLSLHGQGLQDAIQAADYKDPGDYTPDQMSAFIASPKTFEDALYMYALGDDLQIDE